MKLRNSLADYALTFWTLVAQTVWVDDTLKLLFHKELNIELQSELACSDEGKTLDQFIDLAICIDNLIRTQRHVKNFPNHIPVVTPVAMSHHIPLVNCDFLLAVAALEI